MRTFFLSLLAFGCLGGSLSMDLFSSSANAQAASQPNTLQNRDQRVEIANLRADIQVLDRRMREMALEMEDLKASNRRLQTELERVRQQASQSGNNISQGQLNRAIADLRQQLQNADSDQRRQILSDVTKQIEALGRQTQDAIDALARSVSARPSAPANTPSPSFSDDFPKEGISYTVQRGDTLSAIASRHNSTVRDIQNANRLANPGAIQVGQTLFIPQRNN